MFPNGRFGLQVKAVESMIDAQRGPSSTVRAGDSSFEIEKNAKRWRRGVTLERDPGELRET